MATEHPRAARYRIHAYVCGQACVRPVEMMGNVSFAWVYTNRPDDCRYAVVTLVGRYSERDMKHHEEVRVYDLYATQLLQGGRLGELTPLRICDSVDTAIMATSLLYDDD